MLAAQINDYGPADNIKIVEADKPIPGTVQVLVEVFAASLNPFDVKLSAGAVKEFIPLQLPVTLGGDFAGIISEIGPGVEGFNVGDRVYGQASAVSGGSGAFAELAVTSTTQIAKMPEKLSFEEAASLPLTGLSAMQVIKGHLKLQKGQKTLIHGGAGGIGSLAIQIAKHLGAHVATTVATEDQAYAKQLGADEVIDYKTEAFDELLKDYDAVFDTVGGKTYEVSFRVLKKSGIVVSMKEKQNENLMEKYGVTAIAQQTRTTTESLNELTKLVNDGVMTPHIHKVFPLVQTKEAFEVYENGQVRGKIVINIKN